MHPDSPHIPESRSVSDARDKWVRNNGPIPVPVEILAEAALIHAEEQLDVNERRLENPRDPRSRRASASAVARWEEEVRRLTSIARPPVIGWSRSSDDPPPPTIECRNPACGAVIAASRAYSNDRLCLPCWQRATGGSAAA